MNIDKATKNKCSNVQSETYKQAGVDIDRAQAMLAKLRPKVEKLSHCHGVNFDNGFGALVQPDFSKYKNPVIVNSIDGVGTKILVAAMMGQYETLGHDLVNHCVNDIAVYGATPISFLDYIGAEKLDSQVYEELLAGMIAACNAVQCPLVGGETAEMPGCYQSQTVELVGAITGVVEQSKIISGNNINAGHVAVGFASNGLHTNGYSLARKILFEELDLNVKDEFDALGGSLGEALLRPHICYWPAIKNMITRDIKLDGIAHITGGGVFENIPRILPHGLKCHLDFFAFSRPPIFDFILRNSQIELTEAYRVFNMGIGMICFTQEKYVGEIIKIARDNGVYAAKCGEVIAKKECKEQDLQTTVSIEQL